MDLPLWGRLTIAVVLAAALAYATTPIAIITARRLSFYDVPRGYKGHTSPTPYLGGAAVMLAFVIALLIGGNDMGRTLPLVAGVLIMFTVGTIDDRRTLSPGQRVAIEFALGALLAALGRGWRLGAGPELDVIVNGAWVVAVVNSFNLFDNMDGAAGTMGVVVGGGTAILGALDHNAWVAAGGAALCGACLGFLPHNLARPARIFLGDGGSMPLGFTVAALVTSAARSAEPTSVALLVAFLLVGIPALDTCLVVVSRRRRGVPILKGGQDHLTHRTRSRLRSAQRVAFVLGSAQALVSALVIVATRASSAALVYVLLGFIVAATAAIVALEQAPTSGVTRVAGAVAAASRPPRAGTGAVLACLALVGVASGISPLFGAYYGQGAWIPLGLGLVVAASVAAIARPPRATPALVLTFAGLAGLGLWSLLSAGWAQNSELATVEGNRWVAYAALLLLLVVLLRGRRHAGAVLWATGGGIAIVAITVLIRLAGSDPDSLFLGGRLNAPLGYVNGEACVFAMGCWLALALAERRQAALAGLGAAAAVALGCLTLLSQSRGAAIASFAAIVVVLVAVPGFRRRALALTCVAAGIAAAAPSVLHVYSVARGHAVPAPAAHSAALAIVVAAAVAGLVWGVLVGLEHAVSAQGGTPAVLLRRFGTAVAAAAVVVPVVVAIARAPTIERTLSRQWHAFVHLSDSVGRAGSTVQTRLFSGGGNRYDYWRIASRVFVAHPVGGVGAGNYSQAYFLERRTQESVQNPHSIELQVLSELGLVGGLLLAMVIAGAVFGARRLRAACAGSRGARTVAVGAVGVWIVWLVDTSGDWMHLLPGVTAIALVSLAVICRGLGQEKAAERPRPAPRLRGVGMIAGVAFVLAVGGASLMRSGLTRLYLDDARAELASHPASAITDAGRALRLDAADLDAYYVKAAAFARFDQVAAARSTLLAAAAQDPQDFVTWTLLGDLEVRAGDLADAGRFYLRAHQLNPRDPGLRVLSAHPELALPQARPLRS